MASFKLDFEYNESPASENTISLFTKVTFKETIMGDILDVNEFFNAITKEGFIPLFTCDCGHFGCGGYYVKITHRNDGLTISNRYSPHGEPNDNNIMDRFEFFLTWEDVYNFGRQLINIIDEITKKWPNYEICSGVLESDFRNKKTYYENILEQIPKV